MSPQPAAREVTIGSLFTGYGGLDLAVLAVLGGHVVWHAEVERAACALLAHRWPAVANLGDVTAVDWATAQRPTVLTGGFPCQDVSLAGRRAGVRPGTRSGLWAHFAHAIGELRPSLVVIENVRGLLSADAACELEPCPWCVGDGAHRPLRALGAVLGDLATLGYDAQWVGLRAADVGAPHPRFRVFILAWPAAADPDGVECGIRPGLREAGAAGGGRGRPDHGPVPAAPDPVGAGLRWGEYEPAIRRWEGLLRRPAPAPTQIGKAGGQQLSPRFVEWLMGLPAGHVTDVPGLSRAEQLKLLGNGVVPRQAAAALAHLLGAP